MVEGVQIGKLKAYIVRNEGACDQYNEVVFAENITAAKVLAMSTDACMDAEYIDIRVRRCKALDDSYRGHRIMNWYDTLDRLDLVTKANFRCEEPDRDDCVECVAKDECEDYQDYLADLEEEHDIE